MKGWTLEYIDELDADVFAELVDWINDSTQEEDSVDVDQLMEARRRDRERRDDV